MVHFPASHDEGGPHVQKATKKTKFCKSELFLGRVEPLVELRCVGSAFSENWLGREEAVPGI